MKAGADLKYSGPSLRLLASKMDGWPTKGLDAKAKLPLASLASEHFSFFFKFPNYSGGSTGGAQLKRTSGRAEA